MWGTVDQQSRTLICGYYVPMRYVSNSDNTSTEITCNPGRSGQQIAYLSFGDFRLRHVLKQAVENTFNLEQERSAVALFGVDIPSETMLDDFAPGSPCERVERVQT